MAGFTVWVLVLMLAGLACTKSYLYVKNNKIYDEKGGERIFHGVNLVEKSPPYFDQKFGLKDLEKLKAHGINGLRLGVMWPGV